MIDSEIRSSGGKNVDINQVVEFQDKMNDLEDKIYKVVTTQIEFWKDLKQKHSNSRKLLALAEELTKQNDSIKVSYNDLYQINPAHIRMLQVYGNFVKNILNDNIEGLRLLEK